MKKLVLIASVAFVALTISSCKKEYTCTCTTKSTVDGVTTTATASGKTDKMKKSEAEDLCNTGDSNYTLLGYTYSTDCEIE